MCKKCSKRFLSMLLVIAVAGCVCGISTNQVVSAKNKAVEKNCKEEAGNIQLGVVTSDGEISMTAGLYSANPNGYVVGDGVRLRKGPSLTSTVLELMDKGEVVSINVDKSQLSKGYFYVKRLKTGTRGYASTKYII